MFIVSTIVIRVIPAGRPRATALPDPGAGPYRRHSGRQFGQNQAQSAETVQF